MGEVNRIIISSPSETFTYKGDCHSVRIGRSHKCEFMIPKEDLSREHCLFENDGENIFVTDLGSKNGTCVNRVRIEPNTRTKVTEESLITLANIYNLKINAWEVKTKIGIAMQKVAGEERPTTTFQLDLDTQALQDRRVSPALKEIKRKMESVKVEKKSKHKLNPESLKMILGFGAILAFVIYQALGR